MNLRRTFALSLTTVFLLSPVSLPAQEKQEGTSLSQSATQSSTDASKDEQVDRVKKFLMGELDNLIPGDFTEGSAQKVELEKAVELFIAGKRQETTDIFKAQAARDPAFPPVELLQAGLAYGAGDAASGLRILESASVKNPNYPGIYLAFARLAVSQSRLTDALVLLEKAQAVMTAKSLSKTSNDHFNVQIYDTQIDIGMKRSDQAMVNQAVAGLQSLLPDNPKVLLTNAELSFMNKEYPASFRQLKSFHEANPNREVPEMLMASWFQREGNVAETKNWITKAVEAYPQNAKVQLDFANYMVTRGEFPEAKRAIKRVEQAASQELPATLLLKAKIAFADEGYAIAEIHYEKLAKAQPNSFDLTNMYALSLIESDNEEKRKQAVAIVQRNYQQIPDSYVAQAAFGWVMLRLGQKEQAKALFGRVAREPSLAPEVAYFLANYLQQTGASAQAKLVLEPALEASGLFLYRKPAARLLSNINDDTQGALPVPGK